MTSERSRNGALWAVMLLAMMNLFLFADQNLMAPNLTQIAHDFGMSNVERDVKLGGAISLGFWLIGSIVTLGIGYLTDRVSRRNLLMVMVMVGEIPCALTGFVQSYEQLFWLRALTGIGIGGALPLTYSLLGDYFSHRERAAASGWMALAQGIGIGGGQVLAGFVGPHLGWRLPFIIVALPNFLLVLLFWLTVREPVRGVTEEGLKDLIESGAGYSHRINWAAYRGLFRIRTNLLVFLQGIPGTVPWGVFLVFLNDFYSQDKGFSVEVATLIVMVAGAAVVLGGFLGGLIGSKVYAMNPRYLPLYCGTSTLVGIVPMAMLLNYPSQAGVAEPSLVFPMVAGVLTGLTVSVSGPNVQAMLLNVNAPEARGSIFSLFNLTDNLGKGFGPVVISALVVPFGRLWAFNIANLFWVACGLLLLTMVWTFPRDEARLRRLLEERGQREAAAAGAAAEVAVPAGQAV